MHNTQTKEDHKRDRRLAIEGEKFEFIESNTRWQIRRNKIQGTHTNGGKNIQFPDSLGFAVKRDNEAGALFLRKTFANIIKFGVLSKKLAPNMFLPL